MVNSIGVSILIEVIEELQGVNGKMAYCNLAPIVEKTFNIMGISKYAKLYTNEEEGLLDLSTQKNKNIFPNFAQKYNIEKHVHSLQVATKFPG